uniref:NADH dehydrogenase subunit 11 n=1 Tax=Toxarium undulatum TaxID=210620 RepID=A0A2U9GIY5_9STRA|nr:NADH dehydrogenase subunit 11 [Toxarium undulatum]AWQ64135.1 NADH dehydrogenase subunit 11 [Toxarium undulatum]
MCLIEVKNSPKPVVACTINAKSFFENSGTIYTNSLLVKKARENILEFLLLNHPLDCPVCDQGGDCDLQDQALFFGFLKKRFYNFKRVVTDKNLGPVVKTVMTRCIHCTRCVRFATEIAGVEDLGMFGRGLHSEIGTYVEKVFQSELSGNIIDLCPVGALTVKSYPFVGRNWELKIAYSSDYSDGFGLPIQLFLKNNKIVKILPGLLKHRVITNWISDKARFAFDSMFSPLKQLTPVSLQSFKQQIETTWDQLFERVTKIFYFQDHLTKHARSMYNLVVTFTNCLNLETLGLLTMLTNQFPFITLRTLETSFDNIDINSTHLLTNQIIDKHFNNVTLCFLIGLNTRFEGSSLNLKLRQRYLQGNFFIYSINSLIDYTFPIKYWGLNFDTLKKISEGIHPFCKHFVNRISSVIYNSDLFKRKDAHSLNLILNTFKTKVHNVRRSNLSLNTLNTSINTAGINYINKFKTLEVSDLKYFTGLYLMSPQFKSLTQLLNLKLLNYFELPHRFSKILLKARYGFSEENVSRQLNILKSLSTYVNLPTKTVFETRNTIFNTEGFFKINKSVLLTKTNAESDWSIVRNILQVLTNISHITESTIFNLNLPETFQSFIDYCHFMFYAIIKFYNYSLNLHKPFDYFLTLTKFKIKKTKFYKTNIKLWLDDFYLHGNDFFSQYSITMIKCSKMLRSDLTNFVLFN